MFWQVGEGEDNYLHKTKNHELCEISMNSNMLIFLLTLYQNEK